MRDMTDRRFWHIIESYEWGDPHADHEQTRITWLRNLSFNDLCALRENYLAKVREVKKAGGDYCCDSWEDCTAHIVGLGYHEYQCSIKEPSRITARYESGDYRECFSYFVPYPDDVSYLTEERYVRCAAKYLLEIELKVESGEVRPDPAKWRALVDTLRAVSLARFKEAAELYAKHFPNGTYSDATVQSFGLIAGVDNLFVDLKTYGLV